MNNTSKYTFDSKIIAFESFKNNSPNKTEISLIPNSNKTHSEMKKQLIETYIGKLIILMETQVNDTINYLQSTKTIKCQLEYNKLLSSVNEINKDIKLIKKVKDTKIQTILKGKVQTIKGKSIVPVNFVEKYNIFISKQNKSEQNLVKAIKTVGMPIRSYKTKIIFNNEQKKILLQWFDTATKVYNKCVDCFNSNDPNFPKNFMAGKKYIFDLLFSDSSKMNAPYDILTYEVKCFYENLSSCYSNRSNGNINKFIIKHKNSNKYQTISIYKNCINKNGIYTTSLGKLPNFNKLVNVNRFDCDCKLSYERTTGNFYVYVPQYIENEIIKDRKRICAIDPGEKVPFTYYSLDDYGLIGNDIRVQIIDKETKIRNYQRLLNKKINKNGKKINKKKIKKKINKEYKKISGIVNELHKKSALYFCRNYDIILIPKFETQSMICDKVVIKQQVKKNYDEIKIENQDNKENLRNKLKEYRRRRRLNCRVKFVLNQLSHYKFKQHLFAKAEEYGCLCVEVTEEYTSQLCGVCGQLSKNYIKRMKKCTHCKAEINRDVNGSRNILLKYISNYLQ